MKSEVPHIMAFANSIARDAVLDDTVVRYMVHLMGDMATVLSGIGPAMTGSGHDWQKLIAYCQDSHLLGDTEWALHAIAQQCNPTPAAR
jgi:hypothetical protein